MPKKKVIIEGQIHIDDKGTLKKSAKGAHSVDRRLKGAAKASSGASKNFSKMSQGISGGLVPAYATLAASLFALDAVYRGLKEAADLRILQQGQEAYAAATGIAMGSVAHSIQLATDSQISFKEASQAAAIGMAAGLSGEQMERLAAAATSAAKVSSNTSGTHTTSRIAWKIGSTDATTDNGATGNTLIVSLEETVAGNNVLALATLTTNIAAITLTSILMSLPPPTF